MALAQVYIDEHGEIVCDQENRLIQVRMLKHCSGQPLRHVFSKALDFASSSQLNLWLFNMRKVHFMDMADQNWIMQEFFPSFDKQDHHRVCVLVSPPYLELMSTIKIRNQVRLAPELSNIIDMEIFLDEDDALKWLLE